jgi:anhydro-N-acetylmuramic acid kinase
MEPVWAVGLMTGTVLDGNMDVALLKTDGETVERFGAFRLAPYDSETRALLADTLDAARKWNFTGPEPEIFREAEERLTRAQSKAVLDLVAEAGLSPAEIEAIGFHGQTVLHRAPRDGRLGDTRQLGDGALMAELTGTRVVYDFRSADMRAGGQGAPLSACYHQALLRDCGAKGELAILNLGGVANVSWTDGGGRLIAFDTGPANAPVNDFVKSRGLGEMDRDGALALSGRVDETRLNQRLSHPYLGAPYPKSLDRFDFGFDWVADLSDADGAATLTAFSTAAVGAALDLLPQRPGRLAVCGGGRRNPAMLKMLGTYAGIEVETAEDHGWDGDAIEAQCFAFLAVRRLRDLPFSFPTTTGVPEPMTGGRIAG